MAFIFFTLVVVINDLIVIGVVVVIVNVMVVVELWSLPVQL